MHAEKEDSSPTFARMFKGIKEKTRSDVYKEAKISFAKNLMTENFQDEKIAELTELTLQEAVELRRSLQD